MRRNYFFTQSKNKEKIDYAKYLNTKNFFYLKKNACEGIFPVCISLRDLMLF